MRSSSPGRVHFVSSYGPDDRDPGALRDHVDDGDESTRCRPAKPDRTTGGTAQTVGGIRVVKDVFDFIGMQPVEGDMLDITLGVVLVVPFDVVETDHRQSPLDRR